MFCKNLFLLDLFVVHNKSNILRFTKKRICIILRFVFYTETLVGFDDTGGSIAVACFVTIALHFGYMSFSQNSITLLLSCNAIRITVDTPSKITVAIELKLSVNAYIINIIIIMKIHSMTHLLLIKHKIPIVFYCSS